MSPLMVSPFYQHAGKMQGIKIPSFYWAFDEEHPLAYLLY